MIKGRDLTSPRGGFTVYIEETSATDRVATPIGYIGLKKIKIWHPELGTLIKTAIWNDIDAYEEGNEAVIVASGSFYEFVDRNELKNYVKKQGFPELAYYVDSVYIYILKRLLYDAGIETTGLHSFDLLVQIRCMYKRFKFEERNFKNCRAELLSSLWLGKKLNWQAFENEEFSEMALKFYYRSKFEVDIPVAYQFIHFVADIFKTSFLLFQKSLPKALF